MEMLAYLTGKGYSDWDVVMNEESENKLPGEASYEVLAKETDSRPGGRDMGLLYATIGVVAVISLAGIRRYV